MKKLGTFNLICTLIIWSGLAKIVLTDNTEIYWYIFFFQCIVLLIQIIVNFIYDRKQLK